jgi:hypothetical protein
MNTSTAESPARYPNNGLGEDPLIVCGWLSWRHRINPDPIGRYIDSIKHIVDNHIFMQNRVVHQFQLHSQVSFLEAMAVCGHISA